MKRANSRPRITADAVLGSVFVVPLGVPGGAVAGSLGAGRMTINRIIAVCVAVFVLLSRPACASAASPVGGGSTVVATCSVANASASIAVGVPIRLSLETAEHDRRSEADVVVRVDERGHPTYIGVHADTEALRRAALVAARASTYRPGVHACRPSGARFHYRVDYALQDGGDVTSVWQPRTALLSVDDLESPAPGNAPRCEAVASLLHAGPVAVPEVARQQGISGDMLVAVRVGVDGRVTDATVVSGRPLFAKAALDAARRTTFRPACFDGRKRATTERYLIPVGPGFGWVDIRPSA